MITLEQLEDRKSKVIKDIKKVEETMETLDVQRNQLQANLYALQGASQQIEYFLGLITEETDKKEESKK